MYIPKDTIDLMNKMKESNFKGELSLENGVILWKYNNATIEIIFENQPDEAYIILPSGSHDHVPHNELWEYVESLNSEL